VQLELAEATYMEEAHPYRFDETLANRVRPVLRRFIELMLDHARTHATTPATR
jgi:N-formylglutamate amidohydrolase